MEPFRETAFYLTLWHALLSLIGTVLFIVLRGFDPATALLAAAIVTLLFALMLMARASRLTEQRMTSGQLWRMVPAAQRPAGDVGLRMARAALEEIWLRFAKGAAATAAVLAALAFASNGVSAQAWSQAMRGKGTIATGQSVPAGMGYRAARVLPMN